MQVALKVLDKLAEVLKWTRCLVPTQQSVLLHLIGKKLGVEAKYFFNDPRQQDFVEVLA